jgi:hypothetical protein
MISFGQSVRALPPRLRKAPLLLSLASFAACGACQRQSMSQSNLRSGQNEPAITTIPSSRGAPVEVAGALGSERTQYQTRNVLSLAVDTSKLQLGDQFSLTNETTGVTLIDRRNAGDALLGDETTGAAGWHLIERGPVTLRLYLADPKFHAAFAGGENALSMVSNADGGRMARSTITLRDFPAFGFTSGVFATGEQVVGGFQGGFEPLAKASVASGDGAAFLATGFLSFTNQ